MTSLMECAELPTVPDPCSRGRVQPLLSDLTLASVVRAAIEALPAFFAQSLHAGNIARQLNTRRSGPRLAQLPWLRELEQEEGNALVLDRKGLTARGGLLPDDHLFKSMARNGLIRDNHVIWAPSYPALPADQPRGGRQPPPPPATSMPPFSSPPSSPPSSSSSPSTAPATTSPATTSPATTSPTVFNVYALSSDVCGHRGIVHGGLSSAIIDESFGYLLYLVASAAAAGGSKGRSEDRKGAREHIPTSQQTQGQGQEQQGSQEAPQQQQQQQEGGMWQAVSDLELKAAMTAHLEVDFVRPLPADSSVMCVAQVDRVEGRKVWVRARLTSIPSSSASSSASSSTSADVGSGGDDVVTVYATGKALFVTPRPKA